MVHQCSSVFHTEIKTVTKRDEPLDQFWEPTLGMAWLLQPMAQKLSWTRWKFTFFFSSLAGFGLFLAIGLSYLGFRKGCFLKQEILTLRKNYNLSAQATLDMITSISFFLLIDTLAIHWAQGIVCHLRDTLYCLIPSDLPFHMLSDSCNGY